MKIVYIGGNIGEGSPAHATENAYTDAFRALGHLVAPLRQSDAGAVGHELAVKRFLDEGVELVIYTRTHNNTALGPEWNGAWSDLKRHGVTTIGLHLDIFVGLRERVAWIDAGDPLFYAEWLFTPDGGSSKFWAEHGVNHVWLPPACDTRAIPVPTARLEGVGGPADGKVIFVGSDGYHPQWPQRPQLLEHLRRHYGADFVHYGPGSPHGTVRDPALSDLYRSDCIVVGDHCFADSRAYYWSDRVPETLGRGGLLVHPSSPGLRDWYTAGDGIVYWRPGDFAALDAQIDYLHELEPEDRQAVRDNGRRRVLNGHWRPPGTEIEPMPWPREWRTEPDTYEQRARQILEVIGR